jgi:hypothetical protein
MRQLRREAYGKDIGQHSWVTAEELEGDISRLRLSRASRFLDLGCGPGGPLAFIAGQVGCRGSGVRSRRIAGAQRARYTPGSGLERADTLRERLLRCGDVVGRDSSSPRPRKSVQGSGASANSGRKILVYRCRSHYGLDIGRGNSIEGHTRIHAIRARGLQRTDAGTCGVSITRAQRPNRESAEERRGTPGGAAGSSSGA